jgi:predicted phosphodiesterase
MTSLILSDLHFHSRCSLADQLSPFRALFRGFETVVFNGDTVGWDIAVDPDACGLAHAQIVRFCEEAGCTAQVLAGNSDFPISIQRHLRLAGGRVLVMHGDAIFPGISPWRPEAACLERIRTAQRRQLSAEMAAPLSAELAAVVETMRVYAAKLEPEHCSTNLWLNRLTLPARMLTLLRVWRGFPRRCAEFLDTFAPTAEIAVIGHFHRSGVWKIGGRTIVNTGSFGRFSRPLGVVVAEECLSVFALNKRAGVWSLSAPVWQVPLASNEIRGQSYALLRSHRN